MSHVDEGQLNAYVDGELEHDLVLLVEAHLGDCHDCRARLAEARRVQARADAILERAGPLAVTPPPFEELRHRHSAGQDIKSATRLPALRPVAWAATILVAVSIGWYVRGQRVAERSADTMAAATDSATPTLALAEEEKDMDVVASRSDALEQRAPVTPTTAPAPNAPDSFADARPTALGRARQPRETEPRTIAQASGADTLGVSAEEPSLEMARQETAQRKSVIDQLSIATPLADSELMIRTVRSGWNAADERSALAFFGRPIAVIDGLAILSYETRQASGGQRLVRVTHRLSSEDVVQLVQQFNAQREIAEMQMGERGANALGPRSGTTALTEVRGDYLITLQGSVSADSLRALFKRVK